MKEIKLLGQTNCVALIDDEDFERVSAYSWYIHQQGYAHSFDLYKKLNAGKHNGSVLLHRFILNAEYGAVHHIDGDRLNNCKCNLQATSQQQNVALAAKRKHRVIDCPYKGVTWNATSQKWKADICVNYKKTVLPVCYSIHQAAYSYNYALSRVKPKGTYFENVLLKPLTDEEIKMVERLVDATLKRKGWVTL